MGRLALQCSHSGVSMHIHIHICICICIHILMYKCNYIHIDICIYIYPYDHYICLHSHSHLRVHLHLHLICIYVHIHIYIHLHRLPHSLLHSHKHRNTHSPIFSSCGATYTVHAVLRAAVSAGKAWRTSYRLTAMSYVDALLEDRKFGLASPLHSLKLAMPGSGVNRQYGLATVRNMMSGLATPGPASVGLSRLVTPGPEVRLPT